MCGICTVEFVVKRLIIIVISLLFQSTSIFNSHCIVLYFLICNQRIFFFFCKWVLVTSNHQQLLISIIVTPYLDRPQNNLKNIFNIDHILKSLFLNFCKSPNFYICFYTMIDPNDNLLIQLDRGYILKSNNFKTF